MKTKIVKNGYVAMNKGEYDIENMSFFTSKKKAKDYFLKNQEIVKVKIEFIGVEK